MKYEILELLVEKLLDREMETGENNFPTIYKSFYIQAIEFWGVK